MPADGIGTAVTAPSGPVDDVASPGAPGLVEPESPLGHVPAGGIATASVIGRSSSRRTLGLVGQYAVLVLLATIVLLPLAYTLVVALSTNALIGFRGSSIQWHPVDVTWKDRTWFTGGAFSVLARSLVLLVIVMWVQLRAAGGRVIHPAPLLNPRRLVAALASFVAVALLSGQTIQALVERSTATTAWFLGSMAVVAATLLVGFTDGRRRLASAILRAVVSAVALVGGTVVAVGAVVWNQGWDIGNLGPAMTRSVVVATGITVCQVVTSILAAYAFAYLRFPLRGLFFGLFVGTMLLPIEVTLLGNQQTIRELGWIDSNQALILPFAATALGTFLIRQGFRGVPPEIRDAARLDGYGHFGFLWRFAVPLTRPVIASFTLIAALGAWNQYLWPRGVIDDDTKETAQIALRGIATDRPELANIALAAALIVAIPVVLLLITFQRQIIRGLTAGAVKG
jgi:sn-glycerol 3-phosphate transport system permease protein